MWPEYMVVDSPDYIPFTCKVEPRDILRKVYGCYIFAREAEMTDKCYRVGVCLRSGTMPIKGVSYITRKEYEKNPIDPVGYLVGKGRFVDVRVSEAPKTIIFYFEEANVVEPVNPELVARPQGTVQANFDRHKDHVQRTLDELQACVVLMGGSKIPAKSLGEMTLAQVLFMCAGNEIAAKFGLKSLPRSSPLLT